MEYKLFMFDDIRTISTNNGTFSVPYTHHPTDIKRVVGLHLREIIKIQDKQGKINFRKIIGLEDDKQGGRFIITSDIVDNLFVEQMKEAIKKGKENI